MTSGISEMRADAAFYRPVAIISIFVMIVYNSVESQTRLPNKAVCVSVSRTNWKQLRTEGSMLEPPKDATSPSCRGIWMESCRRRPRRRWSQKPVALATCLNKTGGMEREEKDGGTGRDAKKKEEKEWKERMMDEDRQGENKMSVQ